jgi:hypothetical protein
VPDENAIFNGYSFTDECMAGYLAVLADGRVFLYLDKGANLCIIANDAAVEVDKI